MKKTLVTLCAIIIAVVSLHAIRSSQTSGIKGIIQPPEVTIGVWAINSTDSLKVPLNKGSFMIPAKSGNWEILIDAREPYKDVVLEKIEVKEGHITDLGQIKLRQ